MNKEQFKGKWKQIKGDFKKKYGKITDNEYKEVEGDFEKLAGKVQEKYGKSKEELEKEVDSW